ncbi:MAG: hypothetical protein ACM3JI_01760 [Anaerolineae bacterium]
MQTLKRYSIHLKSISPLVMNCDTLANPLHPTTKKMKELTSLKTKQDEHHLAIAKLQWLAGLYYDDEIGVYLSSKMIIGCLRASARKEKKGLMMKAVIVDCLPGTPLLPYEEKKPEDLWNVKNKKDEQVYAHTASVNVQRAKTMRTRPIFNTWEAKFEIMLNTEILSEVDFKRILERAGFEYGIGELRPQLANGTYGRFKLEEMKEI